MRHASLSPLHGLHRTTAPGGTLRRVVAMGVALLLPAALSEGAAAKEAEPILFRVETEVFDDDDAKQPVARSLTLFKDGIAWDFLETLSKKGEPSSGEPAEFVLHDPARERVILVDPDRNVRTRIDGLRLERLRSSLASWARKSDDPVIRWAGSPDFSSGFTDEKGKVVLVGPRVRYEVRHDPAPGDGAADEYRRFADTALLVKALVHPGGLPPFPRLAINRRVAAAAGMPASVRLEIEPRLGRLGGRTAVMRSEHRALSSWVAADHKRVAAAEERMATADEVSLAAYAGTTESAAESPADTARR